MTPDQLRELADTDYIKWDVAKVRLALYDYAAALEEVERLKERITDEEMVALVAEIGSLTKRAEQAERRATAALEEIARLNGALSKIADYIEPHWKGAGLALDGAWLLEEIAKRGDALEQAERRAERLKGHAEEMACVGEEYWNGHENERAMADALRELSMRIDNYRAEFKVE